MLNINDGEGPPMWHKEALGLWDSGLHPERDKGCVAINSSYTVTVIDNVFIESDKL